MFSHKHYVPVLKTKEGERWSLSHLPAAVRPHVTPLLELHPPRKPAKSKAKNPRPPKPPKTLADHSQDVCEALAVDWGTNDLFFLDTKWIDGVTRSTARTLPAIFATVRACGLRACPVARASYDAPTLSAIGSIAAADGRGYMLRITPADLRHPRMIEAVLQEVGLPPAEVDLLIDYHSQPMDLATHVPVIPRLAEWRTFTAASSCDMPASFANAGLHHWFTVPRNNWASWEGVVTGRRLARKPTFADYACRDAGAPAGGGRPSVNLRYTRANDWMVWVGSKLATGRAGEMKGVCRDLVGRRGDYSGPGFSAGDAAIANIAQPGTGTGGPGEWVAWGISHHLVFTANQIQNHAAI